jgi:hypothetical protein
MAFTLRSTLDMSIDRFFHLPRVRAAVACIAKCVTTASTPTDSRPTSNLTIGQSIFDTTLGQPIWYNGTEWVDANGDTA